jgi:glycosyltransferase involved in cell wall biosynthesis
MVQYSESRSGLANTIGSHSDDGTELIPFYARQLMPQVGSSGRGKDGRLNICLISEEYPPETAWGGIGTYTHSLVMGLAEQGHRIHVIARGWEQDAIQEVGNVCVYRLCIPEPSWRWGTANLSLKFYETRQILLWNLRVYGAVQQICAAERLDVIECPEYHSQGLGLAFQSRQTPMVVKLHTPAFLCRDMNGGARGLDARISEYLEYCLARQANLITSPSRKLADDVSRRWRLDGSAIRVIPNPIDDELFCRRPEVTPEPGTLLYVGRLERRKGVLTLAQALPLVLATHPKARLRLVGKDHRSGPSGSWMSDYLRRCLHENGVPEQAVEFTGVIDRASLPVAYSRAAVCVVPSLYENLPYTCLESMACGCAVVASAVGGIPEIITNGVDGVLIPPESPEALATAIVSLLSNPELRRRLGERARTTVRRRFNRQAICEQTVDAYRSLLASK